MIFDSTDSDWKQKILEWLEEAYQFECFLVYAVGSKKDKLSKKI